MTALQRALALLMDSSCQWSGHMVKPKIHDGIHHEHCTFYDVWRYDGVRQCL